MHYSNLSIEEKTSNSLGQTLAELTSGGIANICTHTQHNGSPELQCWVQIIVSANVQHDTVQSLNIFLQSVRDLYVAEQPNIPSSPLQNTRFSCLF
jgi:hypothetical protein